MTGTVFDIKEFSLHDGPGARVTVFLKGCPLRCRWCHNPEGLSPKPQLMYKEAMCTRCGRCFEKCSHPECAPYGRCIKICPGNCLSVSGTEYTTEELASRLSAYAPFVNTNGGGITFSGGEPLMQDDFVCELADKIRQKTPMHLAVQTSGYADEEVFARVIDKMDYVMMDIKLADRDLHKKYTGVYNDKILRNFEYLKNSGKEYIIRIPLIPDITDTEENLKKISGIINDSPAELLSYNSLAPAKYDMLGMKYSLENKKNNKVDLGIFKNAKLS
ncbi:MAG: glycyl-radical enzyme activating protein [Clostridia bacterium]|nr:glycyl-radical enzyme activating protein [Clostridia bacterium]